MGGEAMHRQTAGKTINTRDRKDINMLPLAYKTVFIPRRTAVFSADDTRF